MTKRSETTSIAAIADRVLALEVDGFSFGAIGNDGSFGYIDKNKVWHEFKWADIRALAASALNQAPNRTGATLRKSRSVASKTSERVSFPRTATVPRPRPKQAGNKPKKSPWVQRRGLKRPAKGKAWTG